jgi:hypothetical protein
MLACALRSPEPAFAALQDSTARMLLLTAPRIRQKQEHSDSADPARLDPAPVAAATGLALVSTILHGQSLRHDPEAVEDERRPEQRNGGPGRDRPAGHCGECQDLGDQDGPPCSRKRVQRAAPVPRSIRHESEAGCANPISQAPMIPRSGNAQKHPRTESMQRV